MPKTITCVLGNQSYEKLDVDGKKLLVIHGKTVDKDFAIVPGWYSGNERYENDQLIAVDVQPIDPVEQLNLADRIKAKLSSRSGSPLTAPRLSFWGGSGISEREEESSMSDTEKYEENSQATILVVDDDPAIRNLIRKYLEGESYRVETASNSREVLAQLRATRKLPALMLLDIMMPGETGWQILKELETDPKINLLPVVAISALERSPQPSQENDSKMLYDYLVKPFSLAELSRVVHKFAIVEEKLPA